MNNPCIKGSYKPPISRFLYKISPLQVTHCMHTGQTAANRLITPTIAVPAQPRPDLTRNNLRVCKYSEKSAQNCIAPCLPHHYKYATSSQSPAPSPPTPLHHPHIMNILIPLSILLAMLSVCTAFPMVPNFRSPMGYGQPSAASHYHNPTMHSYYPHAFMDRYPREPLHAYGTPDMYVSRRKKDLACIDACRDYVSENCDPVVASCLPMFLTCARPCYY